MARDIFADRIREHLDEAEIIREGLWHEGPSLIRDLQGVFNCSLRRLAQEAHCSVTYLCKINHGENIMSPGLYLRMTKLYRKNTP